MKSNEYDLGGSVRRLRVLSYDDSYKFQKKFTNKIEIQAMGHIECLILCFSSSFFTFFFNSNFSRILFYIHHVKSTILVTFRFTLIVDFQGRVAMSEKIPFLPGEQVAR